MNTKNEYRMRLNIIINLINDFDVDCLPYNQLDYLKNQVIELKNLILNEDKKNENF